MTTETIVVSSDGKWTRQGNEFDGQGGYRNINQSGTTSYERSRRVKVSYNTPNLWRKVTEFVEFRPRSGRSPTYPRKPVYRSPRYPYLKPRRPLQSERSWRRALTRFRSNVKRYEQLKLRRAADFEIRMRKFEVRLAKYEAFQKKMRDGVPKKVRKRNKGIDPEWHPFSQVQSFDSGAIGTVTVNWRQWFYGTPIRGLYRYSGDVTQFSSLYENGGWPTSNLTEMTSKALAAANSIALNRFHDKLSGEQIHLGQIIAERAQSISLLATSVARLVNFLRYFTPKASLRAVTGLLSKRGGRQVSDDYLAFKFGAEPLMGDVKGAAEAVAHLLVDKIDTNTLKVTGSANKVEENTFTFVRNGRTYVATQRVSVNVRYVCEYGLDNVLTREMSKLGLINPAEILWEVTPWSFVLDWVLPVGNYIRHLTSDIGVVYRRGTRSERVVSTTTVKLVHADADPYKPKYWNSEQWDEANWIRTRGNISKVRTLLVSAPKVQLPQFKNPLSVTHVLEGIALLYQKSKFN